MINLQEEDSEEYGSPMVLASAIADLIRSRTEAQLRTVQAAVSAKPIVMRAEYAHCPNLTIIDTPGFVLKVIYLIYMCIKFLIVFCYCLFHSFPLAGKEG